MDNLIPLVVLSPPSARLLYELISTYKPFPSKPLLSNPLSRPATRRCYQDDTPIETVHQALPEEGRIQQTKTTLLLESGFHGAHTCRVTHLRAGGVVSCLIRTVQLPRHVARSRSTFPTVSAPTCVVSLSRYQREE